jgi:hypothetical protein
MVFVVDVWRRSEVACCHFCHCQTCILRMHCSHGDWGLGSCCSVV